MSYLLTNQNNFGHIKYPSPSHPKATVKSGGCGPCAALMVVENLTDDRIKMRNWIDWVISTGARVSGGTSMTTLAKAAAKRFGLAYSTTSSEDKLMSHVKAGGMAVANVGGKYGSWKGLFSTAGHFVTVLGQKNGKFIIGDPDYRAGKFSTGTLGAWRSQYVTRASGNLIYVEPQYLHKDTVNRSPNYYLFSVPKPAPAPAPVPEPEPEPEPEKPQESEDETMKYYETLEEIPAYYSKVIEMVKDGSIAGTGGGLHLSEDMCRTLEILDRADVFPEKGE